MQLHSETTGPGDSWGVLGLFHTESLKKSGIWCLPVLPGIASGFPPIGWRLPHSEQTFPLLVTALHDNGLCKLNPL